MADKKHNHKNSKPGDSSADKQPPIDEFDGDLGFAADSDAPSMRKPKPKDVAGTDRPFIPHDRPQRPETTEQSDGQQQQPSTAPKSVGDTWVPEDADGSRDVDPPGELPSVADTWVIENPPVPPPEVESEPPRSVDDTWVIPEAQQTPTAAEDPAEEPEDTNKTWVPSSTPTTSGIDGPPAEEDDDPNSTWVPSSTPTFDGSEIASDESPTGDPNDCESPDPLNDPGRTWVPSDTPTFDGSEHESMDDPNKTWVPSNTPTADGIDIPTEADLQAGDDAEITDVDKTWVPSKTPTHHEFSFEDSDKTAATDNDPNKTWVPSGTPTVDGIDNPDTAEENTDDSPIGGDTVAIPDGPPSNITGTGTVILPDRESGKPTGRDTVVIDDDDRAPVDPKDSANVGTVVADMRPKDNLFSQTIGMQDPSSEKDGDWAKDAQDANAGDTAVLDLPDNVDDEQVSSRRTQIWQLQTGDGLSSALTIRNAPVSGDGSFEQSMKSDQPDYQIVNKLAEGGMGAVYVARQTSLGRELAIKTLKPLSKTQTKTYQAQGRISQVQNQRREMFLSEALVTGNLVHPHIIPIHDLCQTGDGSPFYSMKRVHGTPWNETIQQLSMEENLEILLKVCDAMAYAHHNGVVNRDLKPENVMLGEFGEVLVLDWGLAVPATREHKDKVASPAAPFGAGTPAYMSPELWTGPADSIGVWSDIYLLGAILFEAITGQTPHEFPEPDSSTGNTGLWMIIDKVVRQNSIRETPHLGELMDIAMKAMSTAPKRRHASVLKFQESIKEFQTHEESRRLTERATQAVAGTPTKADTASTIQKQGYQNYQTAAALYEEATVAWPENNDARIGLRKTRYDYAALAHVKGDYDLGLQVAAQEQGDDFQQLTSKLQKSRSFRNRLKKVTVTALAAIIAVGTFASYQAIKITQQNSEITALYGDKESLSKETAAATEEKRLAIKAKADAVADRLVAEQAKIDADIAKADALRQKEEADRLKTEANTARMLAEKDKAAAERQQKIAVLASQEATKQRLLAEQESAKAAKQLGLVNIEIKNAEKEKVRADIAVTNSRIASRIRNSDYSAALRSVEDLLSSFETNEELARLPEAERNDKIRELQAQKQQLKKRARQTESPVQAQVISPSGRLVVWGDDKGMLSIWKTNGEGSSLSDAPAFTQQLGAPVSAIRISDDEQTVVAAAGSELHVWIPVRQEFFTLAEHESNITTVTMDAQHLLSADEQGNIFGWDIQQQKRVWSIRSSSAIRDLQLLSDSQMFLYAGSRGGQSADVLAYQLPPKSDPTARPIRKGQLRLPRDRNNPPLQIAVSPDESLLVISNSRNGEVIFLPRRPAAELSGRDQFPFVHATDFEPNNVSAWMKSEHQRPVNDIVFSADGKRVVTASDDRTIGVWNVSEQGTLSLAQRLEGHGAKVNSAGFLDPTGNEVLSASADRFCRFWSVDGYPDEQKEMERIFGLESIDAGFRIHPQIKRPNQSGRSQISRKPKPNSKSTQAANRHVVSPPWITTSLDSVTKDETAEPDHIVINKNGGVQRGALNCITLSDDGRRLITGADDGTAVIWDTQSGTQIRGMSTRANYDSEKGSFDEGHAFNVARLRFLPPNGRVMITTGFDGTLCLWNANTNIPGAGRQEIRIPGLGLVNAIATSPDGQLIVTSAAASDESQRGGSAIVWKTSNLLDNTSPQPLATLTGFHRAEVSALAVNHDSTLVATGARDGLVAVWEIATGQRIAGGQIHVKDTIVSHLEWMADNRILTAGFDGRILLAKPDLSTESGRLLIEKNFDHDRIPVERVAVAPDKDRFVTISVRTDRKTKKISSEMELWTLSGTQTAQRIRPAIVAGKPADNIVAINWSQDGKRLAAVIDDNLQIFDGQTWKITNVLEAPGLGISDAVFAPSDASNQNSEDIIATFDGTASHLWNLKDRSHIADFRPLFAIQSTALLQDNETQLLLTGDRAIRVFQANESSEQFGQTISKISDPHGGIITSIRFSPNADQPTHQFVSSGADGSAALWNWDKPNGEATLVRWMKKGAQAIKSVTWNKQANLVLLTEQSGRLYLVNTQQENAPAIEIEVSDATDVAIENADFSADGRFIAIAGQIISSGESSGWVFDVSDAANPELHCTIQGSHEAGGIRDISFLPDSSYLVTVGTDGAALIWNWLPSRAEEGTLAAYEAYQLLAVDSPKAHQAAINAVAVSASGVIATACENGTAIIWQNPFQQ